MKLKTIYLCSHCGAESPRWVGQCPACSEWNTLVEDVVSVGVGKIKTPSAFSTATAISSDALAEKPIQRLTTGITELDRVLGSGLVPGSLILIGGEPGIGKSTLTLQLAFSFTKASKNEAVFARKFGCVVIASGEESAEQIALRARRTKLADKQLKLVSTNNLEAILNVAAKEKPALLIVDSIQVIASGELPSIAGSIPQIRAVTEALLRFAKTTATPVVLIGHVTKEGEIAGPQLLNHLVDVVLTLEGDAHRDLRLLRTAKNRFGATSEVGVFEMTETGLTEVANPSAAFLEGRAEHPVGSCITATVEGTRPLLLEIQALTTTTNFGYPKRTASGFDLNRLQLLIAVLSRNAGLKLDNTDVFVNVVGGFRINEPAVDLAVALAVASSKLGKPLPPELVAWGEIGLSGEIRNVSQHEKRQKEAVKLGFKKIASGKEWRSLGKAIRELF